jgi:hypothetical protein
MPEVELQLRQEDAKLVFLAVAYHLGRPGSELDPITKQPVEHGLAEMPESCSRSFGSLRPDPAQREPAQAAVSACGLITSPYVYSMSISDGRNRLAHAAASPASTARCGTSSRRLRRTRGVLEIAERMLR